MTCFNFRLFSAALTAVVVFGASAPAATAGNDLLISKRLLNADRSDDVELPPATGKVVDAVTPKLPGATKNVVDAMKPKLPAVTQHVLEALTPKILGVWRVTNSSYEDGPFSPGDKIAIAGNGFGD